MVLTEGDMVLHPQQVLEQHLNAMMLTATAADGTVLCEQTYYSVGGGFHSAAQLWMWLSSKRSRSVR
ncbi:hypothetical protein M2432_004273 [Mycobacterium sp. OTB74]|nr:hypothetical protein [Mycobacterium sp. OTB74]